MASPRRISHRMEPDGTVSIYLKTPSGALIGSVNITEHEARVHGWSLLSDVDPDELDAVYTTTEDEGRAHQHSILLALSTGPAEAETVAQRVDLPVDEVGGRLMKLRNHGMVQKIGDQGRAGSVFAITAQGIASLRSGSGTPAQGGRTAA